MKAIFKLLLVLLISSTLQSHAQGVQKFAGRWEGVLNLGTELHIVFNVKENGQGGLLSTADSPDQYAYGLKCDTTHSAGDSITIELYDLKATFIGILLNDSTLNGTFTQGSPYPLTLSKKEKATERKRPQTPQPPYPYKSEDVVYKNADQTLEYGATITIPQGSGPFPAAVMITGSGPQNRDEELMGHKLFAVIADYLTRRGFIILRVDDRGVGKSTGDFGKATSADFANDASTGLDYLLSRPEVDKSKIGIIGHSEGGMIAPIVASKRNDINFLVLLAGPGVKISDLMAEQNAAVLHSVGISQTAIDAYTPLYRKMTTELVQAKDSAAALKKVNNLLADWIKKTDPKLVKELGLLEDEGGSDMGANIIRSMYTPWFRYFLAFDPTSYLEKIHGKVLALNGEKDIQVISKQNLQGLDAALKKSPATAYSVREIPGLNHLFQTCKECTVEEYGELEESFSPVALKIIGDWLENNVK